MLDDIISRRMLHDAEQFLLGYEWTLAEPFAGHDHIRQADQRAADDRQGREAHEGKYGTGSDQCALLGVEQCPCLGQRFGEHEKHDDVGDGGDDDAQGAP